MINSLLYKQVVVIALGLFTQIFALSTLLEADYLVYGSLLAILLVTTSVDDYSYYFSLSRDNVQSSDKYNSMLSLIFFVFSGMWCIYVLFFIKPNVDALAMWFLLINGALHLSTKSYENRLIHHSKFFYIQNLTIASRASLVLISIVLYQVGYEPISSLLIGQIFASVLLRLGIVFFANRELGIIQGVFDSFSFRKRVFDITLSLIFIVPLLSKIIIASMISLFQSHTLVLVNVVSDIIFSFFYLMQSYFAPKSENYILFQSLFRLPYLVIVLILVLIFVASFVLSIFANYSFDFSYIFFLLVAVKFVEHGLQLKLRDFIIWKNQ